MKNVLPFLAVFILVLLVALYAFVIASFVTADSPKTNSWHWPAGEVSITYYER